MISELGRCRNGHLHLSMQSVNVFLDVVLCIFVNSMNDLPYFVFSSSMAVGGSWNTGSLKLFHKSTHNVSNLEDVDDKESDLISLSIVLKAFGLSTDLQQQHSSKLAILLKNIVFQIVPRFRKHMVAMNRFMTLSSNVFNPKKQSIVISFFGKTDHYLTKREFSGTLNNRYRSSKLQTQHFCLFNFLDSEYLYSSENTICTRILESFYSSLRQK